MKIDIFSRVGLYVTMETGGEKREESVKFIYGVHPLLPGLNEQLKGLGVGQSTTYTLNHDTEEHPAGDPIRITVLVESVEPVSQKEVVRALAESVECGCGCGGDSHHH